MQFYKISSIFLNCCFNLADKILLEAAVDRANFCEFGPNFELHAISLLALQAQTAADSRPQIIVGHLFARVAPDVLVFAPLVARGPKCEFLWLFSLT
jgi:hypothetical protein